ncbi:hypothetical protein [Nocardia abscessus]|uniref:hypothetical protein n=1 Tax=Nocardia abscessus TaxID=120957 RepID=UPI00030B1CC0|nr:hypothetical protein [Nocardia abscessus]MCC3333587.1 hypothetical protein [Nocardia abscessus]
MSRLNVYVYVTDDMGTVHAFGPDHVVPDWARNKITNPNVWADAEKAADESAAIDSADEPATENPDGPPPQGGPGASRQKWADYASAHGVEVEADWKREDIIAACEKAGVPV